MTMDEELMKNPQEQHIRKSKVYTPPTLTRYGKLTELTAAGTGQLVEGSDEQKGMPHENPMKRP